MVGLNILAVDHSFMFIYRTEIVERSLRQRQGRISTHQTSVIHSDISLLRTNCVVLLD